MTVLLHVGTHKTGSKSLQALLGDQCEVLKRLGFDLFTGSHRNPRNHTELHLASLRRERDSLAKHNWPDLVIDDAYVAQVQDAVQRFLRQSSAPHQIFTNEDLSFLRHDDEFDRLARLFGNAREVRTILVRRQPEAFLRSYRAQILKKPGRVPLSDPQSALYVEVDSWLCDLEPLLAGLSSQFGTAPTVIDYEPAVAGEGSTVPSVLRAMGIDPGLLPWQSYHLHRTDAPQ